jgi:prepilin-type N-terminal cleavage/methylation domain-containing protein
MQNINRGHVAPKGFTLIELLVVIAIIGILAGIVLASLGSARSKGGDAAIQGSIAGLRSSAELYALNNGYQYVSSSFSTTTSCTTQAGMFADSKIKSAITAAINGGGVACGAGPGFWVVAAKLKTDANKAWCVSSGGSSTVINWNSGSLQGAGNTCL